MHSWVVKGLAEEYGLQPGHYRQTNVHVGQFRPPDYTDVPELMAQFVAFLRTAFRFEHGKQSYDQGIIQAIVAHVYLELIHPFSDGNGRTGRLLEFHILLRCGLPQSCCHLMSNFYNETRDKYYRQLKEVSDKRLLNGFLEYAIIGLLEKLKGAFEKINESIWELTWRQHVYETFDLYSEKFTRIDAKRRKIQLALFLFEIKEPFKAEEMRRRSAMLGMLYFSASGKTIERDLATLAEMELVLFDAEQKTYTVNISVLEGIKQLKRPNSADSASKA
jgi:Fic family protein